MSTMVLGNPPMEKWMKEQAAKFHGGLCMSKFVQLSEKKRLARLQTVRSTVVQQGWNYNPRQASMKSHDNTVKQCKPELNNVHISIQDAIRSEQTRTGLTLRLPSLEERKPQEKKSTRNQTEPSRIQRQTIIPRTNKNNNRGKENDEGRNTKPVTQSSSIHSKTNTTTQQPHSKSFTTDKILMDPPKVNHHGRHHRNHHVRMNVSLSALTKEREEALALLKTLGYDDHTQNKTEPSTCDSMDLTQLCHEQDPRPLDPNVHHAQSFFQT
jgi:hypothetical protein